MERLLPSRRWAISRGGRVRDWLRSRLTPERRHRASLLIAFISGVVGAGVAVWWWSDLPPDTAGETPSASESEPHVVDDRPDVRLVLHRVAAPSSIGEGGGVDGPLRIEGALLHSRGGGTATVTRIHRPGGSIAIGVSVLPVRLSVNHSYEPVRLEITPRDCDLATEWTPSAQPFLLTWQDGDGKVRVGLSGDHDASLEVAVIRYLDAACRAESTP